MKKARKQYKDFHGKPVRYRTEIQYEPPESFVYLGRVKKIEYVSDKRAGGGDGKPAVYFHDFKRGVYLYTDQDGKQLFILKNNDSRQVTERGIVS